MTSQSRSAVGPTDVAMLLDLLNASEEAEELHVADALKEPELPEPELPVPELSVPELSVPEHSELNSMEPEWNEPEPTEPELTKDIVAELSFRPLVATTGPLPLNNSVADELENRFAAHIVRGMSKMKAG
jgi:hypothetical protein